MKDAAKVAPASGSSPSLVAVALAHLVESGAPGLLVQLLVGEEPRSAHRLGRTSLRLRVATSSLVSLRREQSKVEDANFYEETLTSDKTSSDGQELDRWPDVRRTAETTHLALPSPGSKQLAGIVRSMTILEPARERRQKGRILIFALQVQHKTNQAHQLGQAYPHHPHHQQQDHLLRQAPG